MPTPTLHVGYTPARAREIESLARSYSRAVDILRLGVGQAIQMSQLRAAVGFCTQSPADRRSSGRTLIIELDRANRDVQNALLHLIEEPPIHCRLILSASHMASVLSTIQSRCNVTEYQAGDYGVRVRDFTDAGLEMGRAADVAGLITRGYSMENAPTSHDYSMAQVLIDAGVNGDAELGCKVATTFTPQTVGALRERLLQERRIKSLLSSYQVIDPVAIALLILQNLIGDHERSNHTSLS